MVSKDRYTYQGVREAAAPYSRKSRKLGKEVGQLLCHLPHTGKRMIIGLFSRHMKLDLVFEAGYFVAATDIAQ